GRTMRKKIKTIKEKRSSRDAQVNKPQKIIVIVHEIKGNPTVAFDTATQMLGKEKNKVDAIVCLEARAGKEVATVLSNNNVKDKVVMAMDTDPDTLEWIQKGVIAATISQKPYTMAFVGLRMMDDLYHHKLNSLDVDWA